MSIRSAKMALDRAMETYRNAIRDSIMDALAGSLNGIGLRFDDMMMMTYKKDGILTEEEQETASEAELTAHDEAFDAVGEALDRAAEAVCAMLREADIDEWFRVEVYQYCNNALGLEVVFDGMEYFFTIEHRS